MKLHVFVALVTFGSFTCSVLADSKLDDFDFDNHISELLSDAQNIKDTNETMHIEEEQNISHNIKLHVWRCTSGTAVIATKTVHELTPYDIKVVSALGDSITAAYGAKAGKNWFKALTQYRGVSWSIGGDDDLSTVITLPNILRKYNSNLKGYSVKTGPPTSENARFNVAKGGAIAQDMPLQAEELVKRIRGDKSIDFASDWKLVTLFIGGNNVCYYCEQKEKHSVENYISNVKKALDILHEKLPKTFVNLVLVVDLNVIKPLKKKSSLCSFIYKRFCKCVGEPETTDITTKYQKATNELLSSGRYDTKPDFTVVIQPFFEGLKLPNETIRSFFGPDCFHFSAKGHMEVAKALWKNMFEPVGSKTRGLQTGNPLYSPTEGNNYLYTNRNSPQKEL